MADVLIDMVATFRMRLYKTTTEVEDQAHEELTSQEPSRATVGQHIGADMPKCGGILVQLSKRRWKQEQSQARTQKEQLNKHRSLAFKFSKVNQDYGRFQLLIAWAGLLLKFVEDHTTLDLFPHNSPHIGDTILLLKSQARFRQSSLEN